MSYTHFRRAVSRPAYLALALSALLSFSGIVRADAPANQPPTIALIGAENFVIGVGSTFNDPGVTANDPDGDIVTVSSTTAPSAIDTSAVGTFMITYPATDPGGLTAIAMRQVIGSGSSTSV